jgi:hypothetical protein
MRFRIDLAAALLCAAACAFADDTSQPVTLTLKMQIIAKTSVAYDYDYSDSNGSIADHSTGLLDWTAESSEVWSGTRIVL